MGRPPSPCGTAAAYRRHLRRGEQPCDACRAAKRDEARAERSKDSAARPSIPRASSIDSPALDDLRRLREMQIALFGEIDVDRFPALSKEFRETVRMINDMTQASEKAAPAVEVEDEFEAARRRRAKRSAGA